MLVRRTIFEPLFEVENKKIMENGVRALAINIWS